MSEDEQPLELELILERALVEPPGRDAISVPRAKRAVDEALRFGGYTLDKLDLLSLYLRLYTRVAGGGTYIDAFAGCGCVKVGDQIVPGSAARAFWSKAFKWHRFYNISGGELAVLEEFLTALKTPRRKAVIEFRCGDSNELLAQDVRDEKIDRDHPCFAFLDPFSTELEWDTIGQLASYKTRAGAKNCKVEIFVLVNTNQALLRLLNDHRELAAGSASALDRVMGGRAAWEDLRQERCSAGRLVGRYCDRLERQFGYGLATATPIRDRRRGLQYYMVHASDHRAAHDFMRWAARENAAERGVTQQLFQWPPVAY